MALAVPPDLARRCAAAAARIGWRPGAGLLLAPSAVYAHLERDLVAQGARSAVALVPPGSDDPGAKRFRQAAPGSDSYRSLVSFAAAELALDAARLDNGAVTVAAVRDHHWHSDLYDVDAGQQTTAHVVTSGSAGGGHRPEPAPVVAADAPGRRHPARRDPRLGRRRREAGALTLRWVGEATAGRGRGRPGRPPGRRGRRPGARWR